MPNPTTKQLLRGLFLSASELRILTDGRWPDALIEDYLNFIDNFILLSDKLDIEIDQKIEEINTDFLDGSIPFVSDNRLVEDNINLNFDKEDKSLKIGGDIKGPNRAKQYFFAGF